MTWSGWDIAIVMVAVLNLALLGWTAAITLRIWQQTIQPGLGQGKALATRGKTLAITGKQIFEDHKERLSELWRTTGDLRRVLRKEAFLPELTGATISVSSLLSLWQTLRTVRGGWRQVRGFLNDRRLPVAARPAPTPARPGVAERLGLVPPAARRLAPILRMARTARGVWSELRRRGVI